MNYKKKSSAIIIVSMSIILLSLTLGSPEIVGLCEKNDIECLHGYIDRYNYVFAPLFVFSVPLLFISSLLFFLREKTFNAWAKFAIIYVPISIILIWISSPRGDLLFSSLREIFIFSFPIIFFIISLIVITIKSFKSHRKLRLK